MIENSFDFRVMACWMGFVPVFVCAVGIAALAWADAILYVWRAARSNDL